VSKIAFTDLTVRSLPPGTRWDTKAPAFGIRIDKRRKTWLVVQSKARVQTVVGHYPQMTLSSARAEAKHLLAAAPERRNRVTFSMARGRFIEENYRGKRYTTKKEAERLLTKHFAALDDLSLAEITDIHIERQLKRLDRTPSEKRHAFRAVRCMLRWCVRPPRRWIPHSPWKVWRNRR